MRKDNEDYEGRVAHKEVKHRRKRETINSLKRYSEYEAWEQKKRWDSPPPRSLNR